MWYKKKKAKTSNKKLIDKLDTVFSKYIRLRDADENGIVRCITSGEHLHWRDSDCGHFITRGAFATRWDEQNANAQSRGDNRFKAGRQYEHGLAIDKKWGKGTAEKLLIKSKSVCKFQDFELEDMIEKFKEKIKELESGKKSSNFGHRAPATSRGAI